MENSELLAVYQVIARRLFVLEDAYPALQVCSAVWADLPQGRPVALSLAARYVIFCYRALLVERARLQAEARAVQADAWIAAVQAEASFAWEIERAQSMHQTWAASIPEFTAAEITLAAA